MIKKIGVFLLISTVALSQDKGQFESYSNPFYKTIVTESNQYDKGEKEEYKSFKMNFDGKQIPQSLEEFTIVEVADPISQGNTGTCWCFSTTSFPTSIMQSAIFIPLQCCHFSYFLSIVHGVGNINVGYW